MNHYHIIRSYLPEATIGYMMLGDLRLETLEQPWRDNEPNRSCIPEGTYLVKRDLAGKHRWFAVQDVPERSAIEWHVANHVEELKGCTAFGLSRMDNNISVISSKKALNKILAYQGDKDFLVTYRAFNAATDTL